MKTSNILITTALLIFVCSLIIYNVQLKAEYKNIEKVGLDKYRKMNRFNNYEEINVSTFKNVEIEAANFLVLSIEHGEKEAIWIKKPSKELVNFNQIGNTLFVDLSKKGIKENPSNSIQVVVISPEIHKISTRAYTNWLAKNIYFNRFFDVTVSGFKQNTMEIDVAPETKMKLLNNQLGTLISKVGDKSGSGNLTIGSDNTISSLKLQALGKSSIEVLDTDIKSFEPTVSDSAVVSMSGMVLRKIQN